MSVRLRLSVTIARSHQVCSSLPAAEKIARRLIALDALRKDSDLAITTI